MSSDDTDKPQPLAEHLLELRNRLLWSLLFVFVVFLGLYGFSENIYHMVATPLLDSLPEGSSMIATDVASPFLTPLKLTFIVSIFLSMPFLLFQLWRFIAPGLFQNEKRLILPLLISSIILFYGGVAFAYYLVFPVMFNFLAMVVPEGVAYTPDIANFLSTITKLFFAFGLAFEIPIATVILIYTGVTSVESLSGKRPYVFVGCFIVAMFLTPPDPLSQFMMAIPMWLLFEVGVFLGRFLKQQKPQET